MSEAPVITARGLVDVSHHMFHVPDFGHYPKDYREAANGLVAVHPGAAVIFTGIQSGTVYVLVEVRDSPPPALRATGWDEVVEVSLVAPVGHVTVTPLFADPPDLPVLTRAGPGHYRVRVHARGRDNAPGLAVLDPVEEYLIVVWPGQAGPETVYKQTDAYGAQRRRSAAQEPPVMSRPETAQDRRQRTIDEKLRREGPRGANPNPSMET